MCHISINILPYPAFILSQDLEVLAFNQPAITFLQDPKQNILGQSFDTICQNINIADPFSNIKSFDIFDQSPHKTITVCAGNKLNQPFNWIISAMYHAEMQQNVYIVFIENSIEINKLKDELYVLSYIAKKVPSYIFWKDKDLILRGCNENFAKQVGLKRPEDIVGKTDYDLPWKPEETKRFRQDDLEIMKTGSPKLNIEEPQYQLDGSQLMILTNKVPMRDRAGNINGVLGTYLDITELKNTQRALLEAKEKAETANQAKSNFLATISHEFRTPLNAIFGMAQILAEQNLTKDQKSAINTILDSSQHLTKLINDILVFAKIEANKIQLHDEPLDFHHLVSSTVTNISHQLEHQAIQLTIHYDEEVPKIIIADAIALRQILINLLSNAIKFTHTGEITVSVEKLASTSQIKVCVSDTGIGIPAEFLPHAFDRFTQIDSSYTRKYMGSGLGLSICKNLVELMKGDIGISSAENQGTTVWFTFPLHESVHALKTEKTKKLPLAKINNTKFEKKHLLIIEDNPLNQKVLTTFLSQLGCTFEIASTGTQAIALFEKSTFDIVLSDLGLPDMSGIDVIKHIRATQKGKDLPIIALTAHAFKEDADACLQAGANKVLTKPIVLSTLQSVIGKSCHVSTD